VSANRVIIEVAASRVGIAVVKGASIERSEATHFARTEWTESAAPNAHQLDEAKDALASLAASLNVSGALATVVYTLPGAVVSVTSCPASLKRASAEQAAQLAVASLADSRRCIAQGPNGSAAPSHDRRR
jgi:hypothetical protein